MILVSPNNPIFDGLHVWFGKDLVPDAALLIYQVRVVTLEVRWLVVSLNTSRTSSIWTHIPKVTGALILDQLGKQQAPYHCGKQFSKGGLWRQTVTEFNCTFYSWQVFVVKLAFTMQTSGTCGNNLKEGFGARPSLWTISQCDCQEPPSTIRQPLGKYKCPVISKLLPAGV